jgi:hypothetical protein
LCQVRERVVPYDTEQYQSNLFYRHNSHYKKVWREILADLKGKNGAKTKTSLQESLKKFGWKGLEPALFDAFLFDGSRDCPEDHHHIGPLGIGLDLLQNLPNALLGPYPLEPCHGTAKKTFFPPAGGDYLELDQTKLKLRWDAKSVDGPNGLKAPAKHRWVWLADETGAGFVLMDCITCTRTADFEMQKCLEEIDLQTGKMASAHVHSYERFDFTLYSDMPKTTTDNQKSDLFNRATTTELRLLYMTFILPLLIDKDGFEWIHRIFLVYNQYYWNWRRTVIRQSDFEVMNQQRVELKELLLKHWSQYKGEKYNSPKFHNLDHVLIDIWNHGPTEYTGSGAGDQAHIRIVKDPFKFTDRTTDQNGLNGQLIMKGGKPQFIKERKKEKPHGRSSRFRGKGTESILNHFVLTQMRALRKQEYDLATLNAPCLAVKALRVKMARQYQIQDDEIEFSARTGVFHNSGVIESGETVFATEFFHNKTRRDILRLKNGTFVRAIALMKLKIDTVARGFILVEKLAEQADEKLEKVGATVLREEDEWDWLELSQVEEVLSALPHPKFICDHIIIRNKRETKVWRTI